MRIKATGKAISFVLLFVPLALAGCPDMRQSREIGIVRAVGPAAFINRRAVRDGERLDQGDHLATGANSSISAEFHRGGFVQLNERTDPTFTQFIEAAKCIIKVALSFGEIFAENNSDCSIETETPNATVAQQSALNIRVSSGRTEITVVRGSATLSNIPDVSLRRGEQISIAEGRVVARRTLTPQELRSVERWRARYRFPRLTEIPNLRRLNLQQARQRLRALNLRLGSVRERSEFRSPPGTILDQRPRARSRVPAGSVVNVVVEGESVLVPRVTGLSVQLARQQLTERGLQVGPISQRITGRERANIVIEQSPRSGRRVAPGARVALVVEAVSVAVPSIRGLSLRDARLRLRRLGLRVGGIERRTTRRARPETILDQTPAAGRRVSRGSQVDLVVAAPDIR